VLTARNLAVNGIVPCDIHLDAGECVTLSGASGSGKSLVLRALADLDPHDGDIALDGEAQSVTPAPTWRRQVAYLASEPGWWEDRIAPHFPDDEAVAPWLGALGLSPTLLAQTVATASTGERQRLALIRTLLLEPRVLLLDEPTSGLDDEAAGRVEVVLGERLAAGTAILLVTHDRRLAERMGQRHLRIAGGVLA
jgi:phosphate-transporting ATPase